ncbi:MAG: hypothetical protein QGI29_04995, partial [Pirellulales bacterium]|nr:hypothetical protein [Pirellulales bacterium]
MRATFSAKVIKTERVSWYQTRMLLYGEMCVCAKVFRVCTKPSVASFVGHIFCHATQFKPWWLAAK